MIKHIEKIPIEINHEGQMYFLRIKARGSRNKWMIKYIGKRTDREPRTFTAKVRGYTYKTLHQFFGPTVDIAAKNAFDSLLKKGVIRGVMK